MIRKLLIEHTRRQRAEAHRQCRIRNVRDLRREIRLAIYAARAAQGESLFAAGRARSRKS